MKGSIADNPYEIKHYPSLVRISQPKMPDFVASFTAMGNHFSEKILQKIKNKFCKKLVASNKSYDK